ncbi:MAG: OsmC family protein [Candidatus Methanomethylicia archaeon]
MPEFTFKGSAILKGELESDLIVRGVKIATVSPPPEFGGKENFMVPEEIFASALASCMNTIYTLIAKNSQLPLKNLETTATVEMDVEGMEKIIFKHIHFDILVELEKDTDWNRKKANIILEMAREVCPLRQSWGDKVPITFNISFK